MFLNGTHFWLLLVHLKFEVLYLFLCQTEPEHLREGVDEIIDFHEKKADCHFCPWKCLLIPFFLGINIDVQAVLHILLNVPFQELVLPLKVLDLKLLLLT